MRHKHEWRKRWSPLGNGTPTYYRTCLTMGCQERDSVDLDFTDLEPVQLKRGGFKLVRVPGKAHRQIMAAFTDEKKALWYVAIEIALRELDNYGSDDALFYYDWGSEVLES